MKSVGILFSDSGWEGDIPFKQDDDRRGFGRLMDSLLEKGIDTYLVTRPGFNELKGIFDFGWKKVNGEWKYIDEPIRPDVLLNKSKFLYKTIRELIDINNAFTMVSPWEIELIAGDKLIGYTTFSEISVPTHTAKTQEQFERALDLTHTDTVVLKTRLGLGGKGVQILSKKEAFEEEIEDLTIMQPFIDTSAGVPGFVEGIHDFRVIIAGDESVIAYIRTPAPGKLRCNISQGANVIPVPVKEIPEVFHEQINHVKEALDVYPYKFYTADFILENGTTPYILEINSKPLICMPERLRAEEDKMMSAYTNYFSSIM